MNSTHEYRRRRSRIAITFRVIVAVASLYLVLLIADPAEILKAVATLSQPAIYLALCMHSLIVLLLAWRWSIIVGAMGCGVTCLVAARVTFVSTVLNLTLPTSVGGDVSRVWFGRRQGVTFVKGSAAALLDRGIGLATLILMIAASALILGGLLVGAVSMIVLLICILGLALSLRWTMRLPESHAAYQFVGAIRAALSSGPILLLTQGLSLASHLAAALIAMAIAHGIGVPLTAWNAVLLFPAVLLTAAIPASIGGWGLRELAAIPVLSLAGVGAGDAAAIAFAFGVTQLAAALIGSVTLSIPMLWRTGR